MRARLLIAVIGALCILAADASNAGERTLSSTELVAEVAQSGGVTEPAIVNDDLDLGRLSNAAVPAGGAIVFKKILFRGRLSGVPTVPLRFEGGAICEVDAMGSTWLYPVELNNVSIGMMRFSNAHLRGAWTCLNCRICRTNFEQARFADEATFISTHFGVPLDAELCLKATKPTCGATNFAEASFAAVARFDRARFKNNLSIDGVDFRDTARFARIIAAHGIYAIGTRFRRDVEFRECSLIDAYFGPDSASGETILEATEFGARADFRGCRFGGKTRFDGVVFAGDALFARARFAGPEVSLRGVLATRSVDFRAVNLSNPAARLSLDATAADAIRIDWDVTGSSILRAIDALPDNQWALPEERVPTLNALSRRLREQGEARAALHVSYEAKQIQRGQQTDRCVGDSHVGCAVSEAEWWLWIWPTKNGSDLTWPLAALGVLWAATVLAGLPQGRILVIPGESIPGKQSAVGTYYQCVAMAEMPDGSNSPTGMYRAWQAVSFATKLVFKLGSAQQRMLAPETAVGLNTINLTLWFVWLLGWGLIAAVAAVVASSFPGLRALVP